MSIKPIILCGGSGTRLWPESRKSMPKQFIPIIDKKSLLDLTIERLLEFKNAEKPIIISQPIDIPPPLEYQSTFKKMRRKW